MHAPASAAMSPISGSPLFFGANNLAGPDDTLDFEPDPFPALNAWITHRLGPEAPQLPPSAQQLIEGCNGFSTFRFRLALGHARERRLLTWVRCPNPDYMLR